MKRLTVFDGSHMLYRVMFSAPMIDWRFYAFNTLRVCLSSLIGIGRSCVVVAFDKSASIRSSFHPQYKSDRQKDVDDPRIAEYRKAREFLVKHLPSLGIASFYIPGYEADDLAYVLANQTNDSLDVVAVSSDSDWKILNLLGARVFHPDGYWVERDADIDLWIEKAFLGDADVPKPPRLRGIGQAFIRTLLQSITVCGKQEICDEQEIPAKIVSRIPDILSEKGTIYQNYEAVSFGFLQDRLPALLDTIRKEFQRVSDGDITKVMEFAEMLDSKTIAGYYLDHKHLIDSDFSDIPLNPYEDVLYELGKERLDSIFNCLEKYASQNIPQSQSV